MNNNIVVIASKGFCNYKLLEDTLNKYLTDTEKPALICGDTSETDKAIESYAREHGILLKPYAKAAERTLHITQHKKNEEILKLASDNGEQGVLFAFWNGKKDEVKNMIDIAMRNRLEIHIIFFND